MGNRGSKAKAPEAPKAPEMVKVGDKVIAGQRHLSALMATQPQDSDVCTHDSQLRY